MPVYKDEAKNTWYCSFYYKDWQGNNKKKKKEGFARKKDAQQFEKDFKDRQSGTSDMLFGSLVDIYLKDCKTRLKPTTYTNKENVVNNQIRPYFETKPISAITPADVRQWQNSIMSGERKYSESYLHSVHAHFSAICNYAERYYGLKENPCRKAGSIGSIKPVGFNYWTLDEFNTVLSYDKDIKSRLILSMLFWTGMRSGELLALTLNDFDFEKNTVSINKNYARHEGQDLILTPKTEKSKRTVPLPDFLTDMVKEYSAALYGYEAEDRLFQVTKYYIVYRMECLCKTSGVKKIRIHDLRHSHASLLIELGYSPLLISERLGHENIETTLQTYSHLYPHKQSELCDNLQKLHQEKLQSNQK